MPDDRQDFGNQHAFGVYCVLIGITCYAERLHQGALFIGQGVWQLETELRWVVHKFPEYAVNRWQ